MSALIECVTLTGQRKMIRASKIALRPAAFAVILHNGKVLLLKLKHTGKYHLPGGGVKAGERIVDALKREVREEAGIEITVGELAHFEELFFYYDPSGRAYHGLHFYYLCHALSFDLLPDEQVNDGAAEKPRWVDIKELHTQDFQMNGKIVLDLLKRQ